MDCREFQRWVAYDRVGLLPDPWLAHGMLCATLANLWSTKGGYAPEDFIPRARPSRVPDQDPAQIVATWRAWEAILTAQFPEG